MSIVDQAIKHYVVQQDYYDNAARLAANTLDVELRSRGIRAIVTSRAKTPDSLREKLIFRDASKKYGSVEDALTDVVDLAGVRVALYFPGDRLVASDAVERRFHLLAPARHFPSDAVPSYTKRFSGYWATHYRVRLRPDGLPDGHERHCEACVEVQIASVLMHAWSEVEHDLVYKPAQGKLSQDEYAILDELNGLVLVGEIALERLQQAARTRVATTGRRFANQFDLAAFIAAQAAASSTASTAKYRDTDIGRVDMLFELARSAGCDTPDKLSAFVQIDDLATDERPIAELIIDRILQSDPNIYEKLVDYLEPAVMYDESSLDLRKREEALVPFFRLWADLESDLMPDLSKTSGWRPVPLAHSCAMVALRGVDSELAAKVDPIRISRNEFISGGYVRYSADLRPAAGELHYILKNRRGRP